MLYCSQAIDNDAVGNHMNNTQPHSSPVFRLKTLGCPQEGGRPSSCSSEASAAAWTSHNCRGPTSWLISAETASQQNTQLHGFSGWKLWGLLELVGSLPQPQWPNFTVSWLFSEDVKAKLMKFLEHWFWGWKLWRTLGRREPRSSKFYRSWSSWTVQPCMMHLQIPQYWQYLRSTANKIEK